MASPVREPSSAPALDRAALIRRGFHLNTATLAYNAFEAAASIVLGALARSVALVGFGLDSIIELVAAIAARWRLQADDAAQRARTEIAAHRVIGWSFLLLAAYVTVGSLKALMQSDRPSPSLAGSALLALSVVVMRVLARAKRRVARDLASGALRSEAKQTSLCAYLSAIALVGVGLNVVLGWWWADPTAALVMVPIIAIEGLDGLRRSGVP